MAKKSISDLLVDTLAVAAVERMYGLAGDSLNGITDAIRRQKQIAGYPCDTKKRPPLPPGPRRI